MSHIRPEVVAFRCRAGALFREGVILHDMKELRPDEEVPEELQKQNFWLKTLSGEGNYWLRCCQVPLREGDQVTLIWWREVLVAVVDHTHRRAFPTEAPSDVGRVFPFAEGEGPVVPGGPLDFLRGKKLRAEEAEARGVFLAALFLEETRRVLREGPPPSSS